MMMLQEKPEVKNDEARKFMYIEILNLLRDFGPMTLADVCSYFDEADGARVERILRSCHKNGVIKTTIKLGRFEIFELPNWKEIKKFVTEVGFSATEAKEL